jgi:hypothetical protein
MSKLQKNFETNHVMLIRHHTNYRGVATYGRYEAFTKVPQQIVTHKILIS